MHRSTKSLISAAIAFALVGALSSCTGASTAAPKPTPTLAESTVPATAPAPSRTSTPTSTPGPTAPASNTPAVNPRDPSTWLITFTSVGPLTIGGAKAEQTALLTTYKQLPPDQNPPCPAQFFRSATGPGLIVADYRTPGQIDVISVGADQLTTDPVTARTQSPATAAGIKIASTLAQLKAAYPGIARTGDYGDTWTYYGLHSGGRYLNFTVSEGLVVRIELSTFTRPIPEYCG
jgi:hypothetical protein